MGRAALIFLLLLLTPGAALEVSHSCSVSFKDYYYGGEFMYFTCTVTGESDEMDGLSYAAVTELDSAAISVEVEFENGRTFLFPKPGDDYTGGETTRLEFYVPELGGVEEVRVKVQGYVPVIGERLKNVTVVALYAGEELFEERITVVNRQKFYEDIREFEASECADEREVEKAKAYYEEGKYVEAESVLKEVEEKVEACALEAKKTEYGLKLGEVEEKLRELRKEFLILNLSVARDAESIENYEEVVAKLEAISLEIDGVENLIDEAGELISEGDFSSAEEKLNLADEKIEELRVKLSEVESSIVKRSFEWLLAIIAGCAVVAAAAAAAVVRRRRKW
ncbi:MAG: hypothetical protein ABWW66_00485 [Archaeoglobaceae archaeon]